MFLFGTKCQKIIIMNNNETLINVICVWTNSYTRQLLKIVKHM